IYRLLRVPGLDESALGRVLSGWREEPGRVEQFWGRSSDDYQREWGLAPRAARFLAEANEEEEVAAAAAAGLAAKAAEIELASVLDPGFVPLCESRILPPVLFTRGNQDLLWRSGVALPHSRDAADAALAWCELLAQALAEARIGLVTGQNREAYR